MLWARLRVFINLWRTVFPPCCGIWIISVKADFKVYVVKSVRWTYSTFSLFFFLCCRTAALAWPLSFLSKLIYKFALWSFHLGAEALFFLYLIDTHWLLKTVGEVSSLSMFTPLVSLRLIFACALAFTHSWCVPTYTHSWVILFFVCILSPSY